MSYESALVRLEQLLLREFEMFTQGDFQGLGEILCEKLSLVENLNPDDLDQVLLLRCRRLNRELLDGLGGPPKKSYTKRK